MDNITLRQLVLDELEFDPSIDAANIGVAAENGVITLTGHVSTYAEKEAAERTTRRIKGVKAIAQEIEVRPAGTHKTADDEIAKRAVNTLGWHVTVPKDAVQVKVQNGWITLNGRVEWQYQKTAAADAVRDLSGVVGVSNMIEVTPHASSVDVKKRIEDAFRRDAEIEAKAININVADGKVTLQGKVKTWSERQAAEHAAWSAPGVRSVEDRLLVGY
ncbi:MULTISPECIES: BON domain-containing protein [unclassified Rhizobium]|uniref:BON domain-containing protein n=1 Tax=unclassified Rhizobium TaxID=2613769 RepID=UPI001618BEC2|nr:MULTISPECIES: BON domain-containing protein [unclassified Rhizobium]MBB3387134.1 osmotically-inducible protein OsmY [Rhizobium sp. BK098]MBB3618826.1 osmotically-inducible protein OsmY [Rhizobium sp. BK609]MBB3684495.1 osmotically-inducible protein OsmY [Rhizobium sp. BK612]